MADNNQQVLLYSAFGDALSSPALMSVDPTHTTLFDVVPTGPVRLRAGSGYLNDPSLTPGATTPTDMAALPAIAKAFWFVGSSCSARLTASVGLPARRRPLQLQ
jgi:hypothetical protein